MVDVGKIYDRIVVVKSRCRKFLASSAGAGKWRVEGDYFSHLSE